MIIGVLKESTTDERRVAATPSTVAKLVKLGYEVVVEPGAGQGSSFADEAYVEAGATVGEPLSADIVLGVNAWRCPLTGVAARYTDQRQDNFDIFLPVWLARYNKEIFGTLFVLGLLVTASRWFGWPA